jgi:hypothetical protein
MQKLQGNKISLKKLGSTVVVDDLERTKFWSTIFRLFPSVSVSLLDHIPFVLTRS